MRRRLRRRRSSRVASLGAGHGIAAAVVLGACSGSPFDGAGDCSIPLARFVDGGEERESIPSLLNPPVVPLNQLQVAYLGSRDRVIGFMVNDLPVAIPHKILWWHEVINLNVPGQRLTVTYSPLTGSSLVFDRGSAGVDSFGVSNYVLDGNLVLEDESGSLWPQLSRGARCGVRDGLDLPLIAYQEMEYSAWSALHRNTFVVSSNTGYDFLYTLYPYGDYEQTDELLYPAEPIDPRRPLKERVLGVPSGTGGIAFPFSLLDEARGEQAASVAHAEVDGEPIVVFWNTFARGAFPFEAELDGEPLTFEVEEQQIRDRETGTIWWLDGTAIEGQLAGRRLRPLAGAYVAFWFAWAAFQPDTEIWSP